METAQAAQQEAAKQPEVAPAQPPALEEETVVVKGRVRRSSVSVPGKRGRFAEAPVVRHELPLPEGAPGTPVRKLYEGRPMPAGQRLEYEQPFAD